MMQDGRLFRTWKADAGQAKLMGYLEDYAFFADGLLALYQTTFDPRWFQTAKTLMDVVIEQFSDKGDGGFFDTADDHEELVTRPKSLQDNAIPSGNSMAVRTLLLLAAYTGHAKYEKPAIEALASLQQPMAQYPAAFTHWLGALELAQASPLEIAIIGRLEQKRTIKMLELLHAPYRPNQVIAVAAENETAGHPELVENRPAQDDQPTAYVCQNFTCKQPVTSVAALKVLLAG
jgi:uncharacterized protein YyaL (SSP411 family)